MAENRPPSRRPAILDDAALGAARQQAPVFTGTRREKGGSLWLEQQRRRRAAAEGGVDGDGAASPRPDAKHCWVVEDPRWPGCWPGLLLAWVRDYRDSTGWVGRVAIVPGPDAELVVAVIPAGNLRAGT